MDRLRDIARRVSNWGRWGAEDERGTVNFITPEVIRRAAACVQRGVVFSLALPFAAIFLILLFAFFRSWRLKVTTGDQGMIGLIGIADNDIDQNGRVKVRGEYWNAHSVSPIKAGKPVKVVAVENLTLKVEETSK